MARPADPHAKSALIGAARHQFREHGIMRARIEDITAACGLSKGAFYLHYPSKEALFKDLVDDFGRKMDTLFERRCIEEDTFFAKSGPLRRLDFTSGSERLTALEAMQTRHDLMALELMWETRDVIHVLLNGCQGTAFDGVIWHLIDREQQRVVEATDRLKKFGVIRTDVTSEIIAMMLMGVWVLTMRKMVSLAAKPDFSIVIGEMNRLVSEGLAPQPPPSATAGKKSRSATAENKSRPPASASGQHRQRRAPLSLRKVL
jgi:AcrR family transcriptional regulator